MKIIFFGTSQFAVPILGAVAKDVNLVITEPAKPAGRKQELVASPVEQKARELGLKVETPDNLKDRSFVGEVGVVVSYGKIIPKKIIESFKYGIINIHPSLLPELRGPSPIQTALFEGRTETGATLMLIDEQVDHGPILSQEKLAIGLGDTYETLEPKLAKMGAEIIARDLFRYVAGEIKPKEQDHSKATFTKLINKEDGRVDWSKSTKEIYNQWRAFVRWPGVFSFAGDSRINLKQLKESEINNYEPGTLFTKDGRLFAGCGDGSVEILEIQPEGKKPMGVQEFINGHQDFLGKVLV